MDELSIWFGHPFPALECVPRNGETMLDFYILVFPQGVDILRQHYIR